MRQAWKAYDRLFEDERVALMPEPPELEPKFRRFTASKTASPKVWADAYMLAFAAACDATLVTFDRAMRNRGVACVVLS